MNDTTHESLHALEKKIGYHFSDPLKLRQACHRKKSRALTANRAFERLEFLGDRVLGLAMADLLFSEKHTEDEGTLAKHFSTLVSKDCCAQVAFSIDLHVYLNEKTPKGYHVDHVLSSSHSHAFSDSMEAILGAIYLDSNFDTAKKVIAQLWEPFLQGEISPPKDQKTILQEYIQKRYNLIPEYTVMEKDGPDHAPFFTIKVHVKNIGEAQGKGATKRHAEQEAAKAFLDNQPDFLKWNKRNKGKILTFKKKTLTLSLSPDGPLKRRHTQSPSSFKRTKE